MADTSAVTEMERALRRDLQALEEGLSDEALAGELYRALANRTWRRHDDRDRAVALSWKRAEGAVNALRERIGYATLALDQTGGEGEVSDRVREQMANLGWTAEPLDTSREQRHHAGESESPPPPDEGQRQAPDEGDMRWSTIARPDQE